MESFNQTQQTVFALLRASLWGQPFSPAPDTDWEEVRKELRAQTVDGLCTDILIQADPANRPLYLKNVARRISFWYTIVEEQQTLCRLLQENGIPCAVLKGTAAGIYYPQPTYRTMGDIDLIVQPQNYERANEILREYGCEPPKMEDPRNTTWKHNGMIIELHHRFSAYKPPEISQRLDQYIHDGIPRAESVALENFSFPILPKAENGLVLLDHISFHLASGLGLRQIVDWMLYADKYLDDAWWQEVFQPMIHDLGLETLAVTVTRMCQIYLGLREDITWCRDASPDLCEKLMSHVIEQGNFGYKADSNQRKTVTVLNAARNDIPFFFRWLQKRGLETWPACQEHTWLRPLAWTYQAQHLVRQGLRRDNPLQTLRRDAQKQKDQDEFLTELGIPLYGLRDSTHNHDHD